MKIKLHLTSPFGSALNLCSLYQPEVIKNSPISRNETDLDRNFSHAPDAVEKVHKAAFFKKLCPKNRFLRFFGGRFFLSEIYFC